jgi:histidinol-phosphate aminotransferase
MSDDQQDDIRPLIRPEISRLSAYHVGESKDMVKLDAMENPYRWPEEVLDEWLSVLRTASINRYPDPQARALSATLREAMSVPVNSACLLGNGSDELIQMILLAVASPERVVLAPEPSFVMYSMIATFVGMRYVGVPLKNDFSLDGDALLAAIEQHRPAVTFLAYPNNPTGNLFDDGRVHEVIRRSPGLVVVDEAYHAFAKRSFMSELDNYDNLLVMRTVSKMGLAGLRLGLLAGAHRWLDQIDKVRLPYNINVLTQLSVRFALQQQGLLQQQTDRICRDREAMSQQLRALPSLKVYPSQANFILFRTAPGRADAIFEGLKQKGVLIKNLNPSGGLLQDCLRVTVGTPEENQQFLDALKSLV